MSEKYKNPNKSKGKDGYSNRRGVDMIADFFGGQLGKAVKIIKKERKDKK